MTPLASAGAAPPTPKTPGRRRKSTGSTREPIPRRVSGPLTAPPLGPQPAPAPRPRAVPRRARARKQTPTERLVAFLRSLPDHPLLDRVVRGRAWIPLLGVMLVGIVAMQVELLKLNATTGRSIELISSLQGRNDMLRAQVASASDPNRIERLASRMGMAMPGPGAITFLDARSASVQRALARIHVPDLIAFEAALRVSGAAVTLPSASANTAATSPSSNTTPSSTGAQSATTTKTTTTTTTGAPATSSQDAGAPASGTQSGGPQAPPAIVP